MVPQGFGAYETLKKVLLKPLGADGESVCSWRERNLEAQAFLWQLLKFCIMSEKATPLSSPPWSSATIKDQKGGGGGESVHAYLSPCSVQGKMLVSVIWLAVCAASRPPAIKPPRRGFVRQCGFGAGNLTHGGTRCDTLRAFTARALQRNLKSF